MRRLDNRDLEKQIKKFFTNLYGKNDGEEAYSSIIIKLKKFKKYHDLGTKRYIPDENEIILITYGDQIKRENEPSLKILNAILDKYFDKIISCVHLLPIFPYSSDYGFSVIDYRSINPDFGNWSHVESIEEDYKLMLDVVINHVSRESVWFQEFKKGNSEYQDYFIIVDKDTDLSTVVRPRAKPLLTKVKTKTSYKYVWTTFSKDQIDLNFKNPAVLNEFIDFLLLYIDRGAKYIRLDAIAYLWKEIGTPCIHLKQVHMIVKLFRLILDFVAPVVNIITETNVPHRENISYFGNGYDESQLVYQFPLPPLLLHSFIEGNCIKLRKWAKELENPSNYATYFNFTASHDGIGVRPIEDILSDAEMEKLLTHTKKCGGLISYKTNSDGSKSPYELNISYFNAIVGSHINDVNKKIQVKKFIASQAIQISLAGVPGIYFHSLVGTENYQEGIEIMGEKRGINRRKYQYEELYQLLSDENSINHKVYESYSNILKVRISQKAFHTMAAQKIITIHDSIFSLFRISEDKNQVILILINVSEKEIYIKVNINWLLKEHLDLKLTQDKLKNLLTGKNIKIDNGIMKLNIQAFDVYWLSNK